MTDKPELPELDEQPGYRFSDIYRWAWLEGRWQVLKRFPGVLSPDGWWELGWDEICCEHEIRYCYPDFRWGPWCLEPNEDHA